MPRTLALNLTNLTNELIDVTKWHSLGISLGVPSRNLDIIQQNNPRDAERCKNQLLEYWLANSQDKSWKAIGQVVKQIGYGNLGRRLEGYIEAPEVPNPAPAPVPGGGQSLSHHSLVTASMSSQAVTSDTRLTTGDVPYLVEILTGVAAKWNELGTALRFNPTELHNIRGNFSLLHGAPQSYFQELLSQWVQWPNDDHKSIPTIGGLESALRNRLVGMGATAEKLKSEFQRLKTKAEREESRLHSLHLNSLAATAFQTTDHDGRTASSSSQGFGRRTLYDPQPKDSELRSRGTAAPGRVSNNQTHSEHQDSNTTPSTGSNSIKCSCTTVVITGLLIFGIVAAIAIVATGNTKMVYDLLPSKKIRDEDAKPQTLKGVTTKQGLSIEAAPTLPQLTSLKLPEKKYDSDKSINILRKIGTDWRKFGTILLDDTYGDIVSSIDAQTRGNAEESNRLIVTRWLNGEGKQPPTWKVLIEVLEDIGHRRLVHMIRDALDSS